MNIYWCHVETHVSKLQIPICEQEQMESELAHIHRFRLEIPLGETEKLNRNFHLKLSKVSMCFMQFPLDETVRV